MVAYAAERLSHLDRTTTYVEIGSAGWNHLDPANAVRLLTRAGIEHVRGFHMNTTHYESTERQVRFGAEVVDALAAAGYPGKHFTVDTAENGRPFTWEEFHEKHPGGVFNNAPVCRTKRERRCVTLGIPPTSDVAAERWPARRRPGAGPRARRRLPVGRSAVAGHPSRAAGPRPGARDGADHAVPLSRLSRS
jgi:hypothetical protein